MQSLDEVILKVIEEWELTAILFPELINQLESKGYAVRGEYCMELGPNIVIWLGMSEEFTASINRLKAGFQIQLIPAPVMFYYCSGHALNMPLAGSRKSYVKPRWAPVGIIKHPSACKGA